MPPHMRPAARSQYFMTPDGLSATNYATPIKHTAADHRCQMKDARLYQQHKPIIGCTTAFPSSGRCILSRQAQARHAPLPPHYTGMARRYIRAGHAPASIYASTSRHCLSPSWSAPGRALLRSAPKACADAGSRLAARRPRRTKLLTQRTISITPQCWIDGSSSLAAHDARRDAEPPCPRRSRRATAIIVRAEGFILHDAA